MPIHEPYGIDDPYKSSGCERYPRDPRPGEPVQVRFRTDEPTENAWAEVISAGNCRRMAATPLGDGYWTVDLGSFEPGVVEYQLGVGAEPGRTEGPPARGRGRRHLFEVGTWVEVSGVSAVETLSDRLRLRLSTATPNAARSGAGAGARSAFGQAVLDLSFPTFGAVAAELRLGLPGPASGAAPGHVGGTAGERPPYVHERDGDNLTVTGKGIVLELDLAELLITARTPGVSEPAFRGSLQFEWLANAAGEASLVSSRFSTDADEWLYGLGERFTHANRNGEQWDVRVYEEYKEQGKRTYLPVPFVVSNRGYGLWVNADEPSYFDLRERTAVVSVYKFV